MPLLVDIPCTKIILQMLGINMDKPEYVPPTFLDLILTEQDRNSPQLRSLPSFRSRIRTLVPRRLRCNITIPGTLSIPPHRL
jgi:hypothetical protein